VHGARPLSEIATEGRFDPALLAALSIGAVLLPPLGPGAGHPRRSSDASGATSRRRKRTPSAGRARASRRTAAVSALASACWRPGNVDHLQNVVANLALNAGSGEICDRSVKRLLGRGGGGEPGDRPEITARFFELPLRGARGV
jgi:transcriptional regulator of acetoin/glycerol metabolism